MTIAPLFVYKAKCMLLAGDIGGTHTRLALFEGGRELKKVSQGDFPSRKYPHLFPIVSEFLQHQQRQVSRACFGIAGPVKDGVCRTTNLPWVVDSLELKRQLNLEAVFLLNDLEANAWGLRVLQPDDFFVLQAGNSHQKGNAALISAGTGLGEAGLYWDGHDHLPFACEGGHSDFAPRDAMEFELFNYLKASFPTHVSYERVISGAGLRAIYRFLIETKREIESPEVKQEMAQKNPSMVVSEWGRTQRDPACERALDWFLSIYGAEAGNVALKFLALGGIYVGGGIIPHLIEPLKRGSFMKAFLEKGRFQSLLETIPIRIVLNDQAALLGAAEYARRQQ